MRKEIEAIKTNTQGVFRFPLMALFSGTEQLNSNEPIVLYPNPTKNQLNFQLSTKQETACYVIFNYFGQEVGNGSLNNGANSIDTSPLKAGVYYLKTTSNWMQNFHNDLSNIQKLIHLLIGVVHLY